MKGRSAFALAVAALALAVSLGLTPVLGGLGTARAACGDTLGEPQALFAFQPSSDGFQVAGPVPLAVSATWLLDVVVPKGSTASLNWGDGSPPIAFSALDCGDDTASWPVQTHRHTYTKPDDYMIVWNFSIVISSLSVPVAFVAAAQSQAATATAAPAPTQAPTATPPPATPTLPAAPPATAPATAAPAAAVSTPAPAPTVSATAASTATAVSTATATASATATAAVAAAISSATSSPRAPASPEADLPETLRAMPRIDEISTDGGTIATNIVFAGVTLWVLFSSVLLNQVLQDNRSLIDAKTERFARPIRRLGRRPSAVAGHGATVVTMLAVLGITGLVYEFLNPEFGLNRSSLLLFLSAVLGVGILTYVCSGLEAAVTRRGHGIAAAVRPFPAAIAVSVVAVFLSRLVNLQPGIVYGFVASAAITGPGQVEGRKQGAITVFPVLAALALSVIALAIVEPIRANEQAAASFLGQLAIGAGIIIFIGGIEGVAFNMIPLAVTDGGKLFAWRKPVWAGIALVAAFLAWHVLLNRDRQSFDALRTASSASILVIFVLYSLFSVALWAYFRRRGHGPTAVAAPDGPVPS